MWDGTLASSDQLAQRAQVQERLAVLQQAVAAIRAEVAHQNEEYARLGAVYRQVLALHSKYEWRGLSREHPDNLEASEVSRQQSAAFQAMNDAARNAPELHEKVALCLDWLGGESFHTLASLLEATQL